MLKLSKDTWHYKNYRAWQERSKSKRHPGLLLGYAWDENNTRIRTPATHKPDLCTYTRIAVLYGPWYRMGRWINQNEGRQLAFFVLTIYTLLTTAFAVAKVANDSSTTSWLIVFAAPLLAMAGAFALAATGLCIVVAIDTAKEKLEDRRWEKRRSDKDQPVRTPEPNVLVEFISAKKRKICPLLEFEE